MKLAAAFIAAALAAPAVLCAETLVLRWREIPQSLVAGRKIAVELKSGQSLKGKALGVTPDGLRMAVYSAAKGSGYGKGEFVVPAGKIASLKVNRTGHRGRIVGTGIGGGLGTVAAVLGYAAMENEAGVVVPIVAAVAAVPTAIGYFAGWARDYKRTTIHVLPAEPAVPAVPAAR
jgi:hypothetical protein